MLGALTGVIVLTTVPFVLVQARESWSVQHFEALLRMDSSRSAYGWENLAVHYETRGDLGGRIRAWRAALAVSGNPRYMINLSVALRLNGQLEEAEALCIPAVREKPDYSYQLTYLAAAYRERGNAEKMVELLRLACELNPADTTARKLLMHEQRKAMSDER